ncbi:hypothetical protein L228DRAFT_25977 [Xylona heveae TC161]|uniref:Uncharacterized protein n=1 Tax=Xylona heveae (strain CBS 132557 / TC161) TaxID=1328760 RepID=A0A165AE42_XYLHT|nr:hypothetical protein L228DRAFT_25977 [Xylona heveae TC161]KZF20327.1 hypothetical protein L228DRAFT_25977 [Xylona heveae TC161]
MTLEACDQPSTHYWALLVAASTSPKFKGNCAHSTVKFDYLPGDATSASSLQSQASGYTSVNMGYRGAWNIIYRGILYLYTAKNQNICDPRNEEDVKYWLGVLLNQPSRFALPECIQPFPLPLHVGFDCVNTLDMDKSILKAKTWKEIQYKDPDDPQKSTMLSINITLFHIQIKSQNVHISRSIDYRDNGGFGLDKCVPVTMANVSTLHSDALDKELVNLCHPTPLGLFRQQLMVDIVHRWRSFFNDHDAWRSSWVLYQTLCEALLRVAAWDFEIHNDLVEHNLSNSPLNRPAWKTNPTNIFWFHRVLIVLCPDASNDQLSTQALDDAASFLKGATAKVILFSLPSFVVATMSPSKVECSQAFQLLRPYSDTNFDHSSPFKTMTDGLHLLPHIFASVGWRGTKWSGIQNYHLPIEVWENIYHYLDTCTRRRFAQAAPLFEYIYYSCISDLHGVRTVGLPLQRWDRYSRHSIIKKNGLNGKLASVQRTRDRALFAIYFRGLSSGLAYAMSFDA